MWVLALGMAAVLSAGEAIAQTTPVPTPGLSPSTLTLDEGDSDTVTLTVANGTDGGSDTVTVSLESIEGGTFDMAWRFGTTTGSMAVATGVSDGSIAVPEGDTVRITVTANDDDDSDNARAVLSFTTGSGNAERSATLILRSNDDDESGVMVSARSLAVHEGGMAESYTVKLGTAPSADVTVTAMVTQPVNARIRIAKALEDDANTADVDEAAKATSQMLTFTTTNWDVAQTLYVSAEGDANTRNGSATITNKAASVDGDYSGVSGRSVAVMEYDNVRTIMMSTSSDTAMEGGDKVTITATLSASGDIPSTLPVPVTVKLTKKGKTPPGSDYSLTTLMIGANSTSGSAELMAEHDADANDEKLTLIASVDDDGSDGIFSEIVNEEFSITLMDDDTYTLAADKMEVNEGDEVTLTVKVAPKAEVETKVGIDLYRASGATVAPAEGQDADEDGNAIIAIGEDTAKFTLTTAKDANDSNDEVIVARAMIGSSVIGEPVTINVLDTQAATEYMLSVDPDAIGEADGEASVMVKVMTNKAVTADTTLTLAVDAASTAMDPGDYSIMSADMMMVMVEKGEKMGMTTLMVTPVADAMDEANETIVLTAWMDDAQVGNAATLTIIDGDSTTFTLSGPSDMNLVEGFEYDIEVMASTPVMADTTVMIMAGDASTASADDYMVEDIMIMAGETMGRTKLMVKSDDMPDGGTDGGMAEKLVLYGMVGNMRTNDLSFYLWDLAVPALPVIAQLLLAALMAVGGYRRYRQR